MTFLYSYLAATIAQGVLSRLRVRLVAHIQRLPMSHLDRTPVGDLISRCTSDIEAVDTVFSSGVAVLVANLVRLLTLTVGMLVLSPPLTLVAGLVAPPLVITLLRSCRCESASPSDAAHRDRRAHGSPAGEPARHRGRSRVRPGERSGRRIPPGARRSAGGVEPRHTLLRPVHP
jgi:ABC-type multidrug transport system fused ATPase/permease subunit